MSLGWARNPRSASERSASRRSSAVRWTSTRGADVVELVMGRFLAGGEGGKVGLRVRREAYAAEHPTAAGRKEVPVGRAYVRRGRDARATAQHHLAAHELAVVLTDRAGRGLEARVGQVRARGPLPHVAEGLHRTRAVG